MGFWNKIFEKKLCDICGEPIDHFQNIKLKNGNCCQRCCNELSPLFSKLNSSTVENIRCQVYCRKQNYEKLNKFNPTIIMGTDFKILIDEEKGEFAVSKSENYMADKPDIISCADMNRCIVDIIEHRKEVKYKDSNGEVHSFAPPYFAYSYDFFVEIGVNIPYINVIKFKVNSLRVDNGQRKLIDMGQDGIINKLKDKLYTNRSYNGKTSNADEVIASAEYKKYENIANEIKDCLLYQKSKYIEMKNAEKSMIYCPWCHSKIPRFSTFCEHCGGPTT